MRFITTILSLFSFTGIFAQAVSYFDPAQAYNRLLIEKNNGAYTQISNYKVTGSSYLYGQKNLGDIYSPSESGTNIPISYNVYNQQVEFSPSGGNAVLVKEPSTLDSFKIRKNTEVSLETNITFLYASVLGSKDKNYYQVMLRGKKVSLYKKYTAELGIVSTSIVQADLRQFNINVDYYYTDSSGKGLKKLKVSSRNLAKEFASIKDLSSFIDQDALTAERDNELMRVFAELNKE
jgi:hypothetical protein